MTICRDKSQVFKTRRRFLFFCFFCGRMLADRKFLTDAPLHRHVSLIHQLLLELIRPTGWCFMNVPHECGVFAFTESSNTSHIKHSLALICFRVVYLNLLTYHSVGPCTVSQVKVEPSHWSCKSGFI